MEQFFPELKCSDAHQSLIIGGDADVDHIQTIGGGYSQIIGGVYPHHPPPPPPRVSAPLPKIVVN